MKHFPFLLAALVGASPALATTVPSPHLDSSTPRIAPADTARSPGFIFYGSNLEPTPAQAGTDQYTINTHAWQYYQLELQVETDAGLQASVLCSNENGAFGRGCTINAAGPDQLVIQIDQLTLPGWRDGLTLRATAHVALPGGVNLRSNTLLVPFARSQTTLAITAQTKTSFKSDQSDWGLRLAATGLDRTANVRFDGNGFADATVVVGGSGQGTVIFTVPTSARANGHHTVQVCNWGLDNGGPGERASCSTPASYEVVMELHRMPGAVMLPSAAMQMRAGTMAPHP